MREAELQREILNAFEYDPNIKLFRNNTGMIKAENKRLVRFGQVGSADLLGIVKHFRCKKCDASQDGVFLAIEVKSDKGKVTELQKRWQETISKYSGIVLVVRPEPDDPVYLRRRIEQQIYSRICPHCQRRE